MSESEFDITTPRYFYFRHKGFQSVQVEAAKNARLIAYFGTRIMYYKRKAYKRPEDLYPLPGDVETLETIESRIAKDRQHMASVLKIAKDIDFFAGETMPKILPEA